jgi:hypothetical protein
VTTICQRRIIFQNFFFFFYMASHKNFDRCCFRFLLEYAALRPRETSAAATAAVSAAVAAAAAASTSQQGLTESLTALQAGMNDMANGKSILMRTRKSSQDSGAVIPSDDEDGMGGGIHLRSSSHASGHHSNHCQRVENKLLNCITDESVPSTAAAAVATWRAFNRPRMALAVLAVSLQHIAAHSDHLQYHQHRRNQQDEMMTAKNSHVDQIIDDQPNQIKSLKQSDDDQVVVPLEQQQLEIVPPPPPPLPALLPADIRTSSLDEGIEPDR